MAWVELDIVEAKPEQKTKKVKDLQVSGNVDAMIEVTFMFRRFLRLLMLAWGLLKAHASSLEWQTLFP